MDIMTASGHVDAFIVGPDGSRRKVAEGKNTLLYRCADAVAHMFAGSVDYVPATIGVVCSSDLSANHMAGFNFTDGNRTTLGEEDIVLPGNQLTVHDIPIGQNKQFSATTPSVTPTVTGGGYSGNKITLGAVTTDNGSAEDVYGFLLKDASGRVLAVKKLSAKVRRAANYAIAVSWAVTFN